MNVNEIREKYAVDAVFISSKGFTNEKGERISKKPGNKSFYIVFNIVNPDGSFSSQTFRTNISAKNKQEAIKCAEEMERKDKKLVLKNVTQMDSVNQTDAVSEIKKQSFLKRCAKLGALDHQAKGFLLANGVGDLIEKLGPEGAADYICEAHEVRKRLTGKIGEYRYQVKLAPKKGPKGINGGRIVDLMMYGPNSAKVPIPGFENGSWESFRQLSKEEKNVVNTIVSKYSK